MYLWVVLTTFLALLAAYVLPMHHDTQQRVTVPVAKAKMIKLVVKQRAGYQLIKENCYPYYSTEEERKVNFQPGKLDVSPYLTYGFVDSDDFTTAVYCMDKDMTMLRSGADACRKSEDERVLRLLVTFGAIPERWQTIKKSGGGYDIKPSPDMMQAMRDHFGSETMAGYVIKKGSGLYIVTYEGVEFEVPSLVANDSSLLSYSLKDCVEDNGSCLAYMEWR